MSQQSSIEWTDVTWNPATGCSKVSEGCKFCYAETLALRLKAMGNARYDNGFEFTMHWDKIEEPRAWKKPRKVFVNSMSDLFHEQTDERFVRRVFEVMMDTPRHQYQILTKRPEKMAALLDEFIGDGLYRPSPHIWLGTSLEGPRVIKRLEALKRVPAAVRFLSCEPLLGWFKEIDLGGIDWVITGGESGIHLWNEKIRKRRALVEYVDGQWVARPDRSRWVVGLRDHCLAQDVAFFFKQWGGNTPKAGGRVLEGRTWDEYPLAGRQGRVP
ncbi:MAG: phage Gp37/Gp68 family protein [Bradymonadaceae bacterium]|nr:phage Gp37/Gp68 family protein [Lujinxingiaceae bacterium]